MSRINMAGIMTRNMMAARRRRKRELHPPALLRVPPVRRVRASGTASAAPLSRSLQAVRRALAAARLAHPAGSPFCEEPAGRWLRVPSFLPNLRAGDESHIP
jgi:hypothetical protein